MASGEWPPEQGELSPIAPLSAPTSPLTLVVRPSQRQEAGRPPEACRQRCFRHRKPLFFKHLDQPAPIGPHPGPEPSRIRLCRIPSAARANHPGSSRAGPHGPARLPA